MSVDDPSNPPDTPSVAAGLLANSHFFDNLVALIPPKFYHDKSEEQVHVKFLKKDAKAEAKAAFKQQYKKQKRERLNPDTALTSLEIQQQQLVKKNGGDDNAAVEPSTSGVEAETQFTSQAQGLSLKLYQDGQHVSKDELHARLQQRLQSMKEQREGNNDRKQQAKSAKKWREKRLKENAQNASKQQKRKRQEEPAQQATKAAQPKQQQHKVKRAKPGDGGEGGEQLAFGKFELDDKRQRAGVKGKPKATKTQLLAEAERRAELKQQLNASEEGKQQLKRAAWGTALARAKGERVLDDPKLLRKSLKKESKLKEKKAKAWQERVGKQQAGIKSRQNRRTENIQAKIQAKVDKKKERREKKLMRAGFEGRKEGFITPGAK